MSEFDALAETVADKVYELALKRGDAVPVILAALDEAHTAGVAAERARWVSAVETEQMETREGSPADYALDQLLRKMRQ